MTDDDNSNAETVESRGTSVRDSGQNEAVRNLLDQFRGENVAKVDGMFGLAVNDQDPSELDVDDYVEPLKLTDGRLSLKMFAAGWNGFEYVTWSDGGLKKWPVGIDMNIGDIEQRHLESDINDDEIVIRPVMTEETPLSEVLES